MTQFKIQLTPAITGEKARSGFESSAEGTMVDGDVIWQLYIQQKNHFNHR